MSDADRIAAATALGLAPRTLLDLHAAVKARLETIAARYEFGAKGGSKTPDVINGWLPPMMADKLDVSRFPFILVRPKQGKDSEANADANARATVDIIVGTYCDEEDGWFDVAVLIDAIRLDIGSAPILERTAFEHVGPLDWVIPEEQPRPQWFGVVTTTWNLPRPYRAQASTL